MGGGLLLLSPPPCGGGPGSGAPRHRYRCSSAAPSTRLGGWPGSSATADSSATGSSAPANPSPTGGEGRGTEEHGASAAGSSTTGSSTTRSTAYPLQALPPPRGNWEEAETEMALAADDPPTPAPPRGGRGGRDRSSARAPPSPSLSPQGGTARMGRRRWQSWCGGGAPPPQPSPPGGRERRRIFGTLSASFPPHPNPSGAARGRRSESDEVAGGVAIPRAAPRISARAGGPHAKRQGRSGPALGCGKTRSRVADRLGTERRTADLGGAGRSQARGAGGEQGRAGVVTGGPGWGVVARTEPLAGRFPTLRPCRRSSCRDWSQVARWSCRAFQRASRSAAVSRSEMCRQASSGIVGSTPP